MEVNNVKKLNALLMIMFAAMMLVTSVASAKSFGGRSSSSSSRPSISRSSTGSGSSRFTMPSKSTAIKTGVAGAAVAGAYYNSKPAAPIKVTRDNVMGSLSGGKGATGDAAGVLYKDFQARNTVKPVTKINVADIEKTFSKDYRSNRKTEYYGAYRQAPSQQYQQATNHSYGFWDGMMFASMLDNVGDRRMYYNHQTEPAFQQWRTDANSACANGDKSVCDKLADLDREMAEYKSKGVKQDPTYMTPGIDPDIYESNNIDPKTLPTLKICTGSTGSDYNRYVSLIGKVTKMTVIAVPTNGSGDNLAKLASGECDLGFIQNDLIVTPNIKTIVTLNQLEVGMLVCPKYIKRMDDLSIKETILVGSDQTGSQFTLERLREVVPALAKATVDNTHPILESVNVASSTANTCVFAVSTPDFVAFKQLDQSNKFVGIPLSEANFKDGKTPYQLVMVMVEHYKNLTQEEFKKRGWFKSGGTDTISVLTSLVAPQNWIDQNKQMYDLLLLESTNLKTSLQ